MNKVSVIIPIYNLEACIESTIESVRNQTYSNIEIILVDDGSTDKSGEICDNLAKKDARIRVYHKTNGGVSSARNLGIEHASGDYVMFVDGDDLLEKNAAEEMLNNMLDYNSDMCICSKHFINEDPCGFAAIDRLDEDIFPVCQIAEKHLEFNVTSSLWLCIIKYDCLKDIRFDETIHTLEDWKFLFDVFMGNVKNISVCRKPLYHYIVRVGSASHSTINERKMTCFNMVEDVLRQTKKRYPEYIKKARSVEGRLLLHLAVIAGNSKKVDKKYNKQFKKLAIKNLWQILSDKSVLKRQKIYMLMLSITPKLYYFAYRLKHN